ncbi:hypothetical protein COCSUDRAFT_59484 [Coccomyxa subellipsoidea C-169]|uniref:Uncharacterized protein n=1 Tax=Coccomyxa subellipsoidea (strain C-169) TaxID=574566 RepID=I0Z8M2_COCSC|nr:hypothetical protein COCSUDRAFT_59484 [Coccomyxa subellipsoidea C-169]EIE26991.1 hypothetical protein COCSUDRAFT_59484 [Coccomyxa subellipsoidea C-169]|eukprot:XP_005651535.1 hypothetical protein COCSUDRAFT_59484 [Coccomyxa subellipsoidea C-169]
MATARPPEYAVGLRQSAGGSAARLGGGDSAACSGSGGPAGVQAGSGGNAADSPRSPHQPDTDANQGRRDQCENSESEHNLKAAAALDQHPPL